MYPAIISAVIGRHTTPTTFPALVVSTSLRTVLLSPSAAYTLSEGLPPADCPLSLLTGGAGARPVP